MELAAAMFLAYVPFFIAFVLQAYDEVQINNRHH